MKKIKILPGIVVRNVELPGGIKRDLDFTMKRWLDTIVHGHQRFGKGLEGVEQGLRIKNAYADAKKEFQLENADFKELEDAVENSGLNPQIAIACHLYYKAVDEAVDVEVVPKPTKKTAAKKKN